MSLQQCYRLLLSFLKPFYFYINALAAGGSDASAYGCTAENSASTTGTGSERSTDECIASVIDAQSYPLIIDAT